MEEGKYRYKEVLMSIKRWRMIVNRVILKRKTENRLNQIKTFLAGAKTAAEVEKLVEKDWQRAEYFGKGKKEFVKLFSLQLPDYFE